MNDILQVDDEKEERKRNDPEAIAARQRAADWIASGVDCNSLLPGIYQQKQMTYLMRAAEDGEDLTVEFLLGVKGLDVNRGDYKGRSALLIASHCGYVEVVELLVGHTGIQLDKADDAGETPLLCAASEGHDGIVECLLAAKADANHVDNSGCNPLFWASETGMASVVSLLVQSTADPNALNNGVSPLSHALACEKWSTAQLLVVLGASVCTGTCELERREEKVVQRGVQLREAIFATHDQQLDYLEKCLPVLPISIVPIVLEYNKRDVITELEELGWNSN